MWELFCYKYQMLPLNRILVRANNFIGDVVMALPAMAALREAYPRAEITVLAQEWVSPVLRSCPTLVDRVLSYDRPFHKTAPGRKALIQQLRSEHFDAVLLFQKAFEIAWVMRWARIPVRVGFSVEGRGWLLTHKIPYHRVHHPVHRILRNLELLQTIGIHSDRVLFPMEIPPAAQEWATQWLAEKKLLGRPLIGIHPNVSKAGGTARQWPIERFKDLITRLLKGPYGVVLLGSAVSNEMFQPLIDIRHPQFHSLLGKTDLIQSMALFKRLNLLMSCDSGPVHMAYALNTPVIAIFGPTNPHLTGPWGDRSATVQAPVDCRPCFETHCPIDHRCMNWIRVEDVLQAASRFIDFPQEVSISL
ncbi:MAG: lipopolysaccharide heptosyltransferase II [Deltaproteobacteria bacterium]|nr:lipopolysaccharide heptosyltransferase II [Deltaproteobacteria bacterium]